MEAGCRVARMSAMGGKRTLAAVFPAAAAGPGGLAEWRVAPHARHTRQQLKRAKARNTDAEKERGSHHIVWSRRSIGGRHVGALRRHLVGADEAHELTGRVEPDRDDQGLIGVDERELVEAEPIGASKVDRLRIAEGLQAAVRCRKRSAAWLPGVRSQQSIIGL